MAPSCEPLRYLGRLEQGAELGAWSGCLRGAQKSSGGQAQLDKRSTRPRVCWPRLAQISGHVGMVAPASMNVAHRILEFQIHAGGACHRRKSRGGASVPRIRAVELL